MLIIYLDIRGSVHSNDIIYRFGHLKRAQERF